MTAHELIKKLEQDGWEKVRKSGSHVILKKPGYALLISVPEHGQKDLKPGLLAKLLKIANLRVNFN